MATTVPLFVTSASSNLEHTDTQHANAMTRNSEASFEDGMPWRTLKNHSSQRTQPYITVLYSRIRYNFWGYTVWFDLMHSNTGPNQRLLVKRAAPTCSQEKCSAPHSRKLNLYNPHLASFFWSMQKLVLSGLIPWYTGIKNKNESF